MESRFGYQGRPPRRWKREQTQKINCNSSRKYKKRKERERERLRREGPSGLEPQERFNVTLPVLELHSEATSVAHGTGRKRDYYNLCRVCIWIGANCPLIH